MLAPVNTGDHPWLRRFAAFTAAITLVLVCIGGLVTSHGAGLAVPDWPTTYGDNMFFFPFSKWMGGILYEHSHRLVASAVGLLTVVLAVWIWVQEKRRWLRNLGVIAVIGVILQGVLGGLRVTQMKDEIGIFHAALAQLFFVLICALTLFCSVWWKESPLAKLRIYDRNPLRYLLPLTTGMILLQLILGATMRHQHAGLAIPDFPAAYGKVWPDLDPASVARYNQTRIEARAVNPITAVQVVLQMAHRILALAILAAVVWTAVTVRRILGNQSILTRLGWMWAGLICLQGLLGAATLWTNKLPAVATAHVAVGALCLMTGAMLTLMAYRLTAHPEVVADVAARPLGTRRATTMQAST